MTAQFQVISIAVCTYNRAEMLGPALASLISQETCSEFSHEIVIIDDGSTDETAMIVRQVAAGSSVPVRYVRDIGKGIAFARNRGIQETAGEWIAFFDDDQVAEKGWLRGLFIAAKETGAQIVGGVRLLQSAEGEMPRFGPLTREILGEKVYGARMRASNRYTLACTGNVMIHRSVFSQIGLFDTTMHRGMSDIDLTRRAHDAGIPSWYTPHAIVHHLLPPHRLREDYIKWTSLRVGTNLAQINYKSWGAAGMLFLCLLRLGHALSINLLMSLSACITQNPMGKLERKCYRWIAEGFLRMSIYLLSPGTFRQEEFLKTLAFRASGNPEGGRFGI
jgi:glycosyltransferase involved in cell wall biosynthesis